MSATPFSRRRLARLNRRQRKKRHVGEFQECLFRVSVEFRPGLDESGFDAWVQDFLGLMEQRQLLCVVGGGGDSMKGTSAMVFREGRQSPDEADRVAVQAWLQARPEVAQVQAEGLVDAWYGVVVTTPS